MAKITETFSIGDLVWYVQSGTDGRYVTCPDCFGACVLTVILGDGSEVSIDCDCCREGYRGSRGQVKAWDWYCEVKSGSVTGVEIDTEGVRYKVGVWHSDGAYSIHPDEVFSTKAEAEIAAAKALANHQQEELHRFNNVKDHKGRQHTWAWNVTYHRREAARAKEDLAYHESRLAVAKAKAKEPKTEAA